MKELNWQPNMNRQPKLRLLVLVASMVWKIATKNKSTTTTQPFLERNHGTLEQRWISVEGSRIHWCWKALLMMIYKMVISFNGEMNRTRLVISSLNDFTCSPLIYNWNTCVLADNNKSNWKFCTNKKLWIKYERALVPSIVQYGTRQRIVRWYNRAQSSKSNFVSNSPRRNRSRKSTH